MTMAKNDKASDSSIVSATPTLGSRFAACAQAVRTAEKAFEVAVKARNELAKEVYDLRKSEPFTGQDGGTYVAMIRQTKNDDGTVNEPTFFFKAMTQKPPTAL